MAIFTIDDLSIDSRGANNAGMLGISDRGDGHFFLMKHWRRAMAQSMPGTGVVRVGDLGEGIGEVELAFNSDLSDFACLPVTSAK